MATLDEIFASMPDEAAAGVHDLLTIDAEARTIDVPQTESIFGVENDGRAETKYFKAPRYVGNGIDLASCFLRVNFQNANGDRDGHLVEDLTVSGDYVHFSWELSKKVTQYKGVVQFLVCANLPGSTKVADWHTTLAQGTVLEGLEPDAAVVEAASSDIIAQLLQTVKKQIAAVEAEGAAQIDAVQEAAAAATAEAKAAVEAKGAATLATIPEDYTALDNRVDALARSTAGAIVCAVEGETIQVHDASDHHLHGLRIFGRSIQDGTPSPDAPVEIVSTPAPVVGVYGKNLAHPLEGMHTVNGYTVTPNADGTITISGAAAAAVDTVIDLALWSRTGQSYTPALLAANKVYTLTCWKNGVPTITPAARQLLADGTVKWGWTSVEAQDRQITKLYRQFTPEAGDTSMCGTYAVQIECGDVSTDYEPYTGQALDITTPSSLPGIPVASGGNYTDANGQQWICDEVDLGRGVYVQRLDCATFDGSDGEEIELSTASPQTPATNVRFDFHDKNIGNVKIQSTNTEQDLLCNYAVAASKANRAGAWLNSVGEFYGRLSLDGTIASTVAEIKALLQEKPIVFVFPLDTPIETALSDAEVLAFKALRSNKPTTTVLNDAGAHMAVEYVADTKLYIDRKIAELVAATNT